MSRIFIVSAVICLLACGGKTAEEMLVGNWTYLGEDMVEYFDDGTVQAYGQDMMRWEVEEGDPAILRVYHMDNDSLDSELEIRFDGDDILIMTHEELDMTVTLEREK